MPLPYPPQPVRGERLGYYYALVRSPYLGWAYGGFIRHDRGETAASALAAYNQTGLCVGVFATALSYRLLRPQP